MCGIIGYNGSAKNAKEAIIAGLKNLEYRGYDSAGIALVENKKVDLYKSQGKISKLEDSLKDINTNSNIGIGHTRWATHGIPNEINAHPHKVGKVTLVHNGIIENYAILKNELISKGVTFKTQTDSEVACAYINYMYEKELENNSETPELTAIIKACKDFRGSYAFGVIFDNDTSSIYATRKDSPLIIGVGENENFIASDVSAILDYTKEYILLEEGEFAKITNTSIDIFDSNLKKITKEINTATWSANKYKKNGYDHFMLKEINEQPKVLSDIFKRYMKDDTLGISLNFGDYNKIHIVACGSAMHAGLVGKYLFENYADVDVTVEIASEYRYKNMRITPKTLVILISQSGETADTLAALRIAKQKSATTLSIVNAVGSTIAREADINIYTYAGPEIAVATTKGYTSQVAILSLLCINAMKQKNILDSSFFSKICDEFSNISNLITEVINQNDKYKEIAKCLYKRNDIFFIGRGIDYSLCMEGSLKLKEISYIHSEAYGAGELKHGTISLIEDGTPVIAIATNDTLYEKTVSNIKETKARGSFSIFITTSDECSKDFADITLKLQKLSEFVEPLLIVTALQLIAYETAKLKGCDIDKPKNLAKSVTVE